MVNIYAITAWLTTATALSVGVLVYSKNAKNSVNKRWFTMSICIALWSLFLGFMFFSKSAVLALICSQALMFGANLIPITFYRFSLALLGLEADKKQNGILLAAYAVTLFLMLINSSSLFIKNVVYQSIINCFYPKAGPFFIFFIIQYFLLPGYACILMYRSAKTLHGQQKNQIKLVMFASIIGFLGGATTFPLWYDFQIPPIGSHFVWLYALTITIAILRYRLMDIKIAITRAIVFIFVYTVVLGLPFVFSIWAKGWFVGLLGTNWWLGPLGMMALFATVGPYLYVYIDKRAEERFFRQLKQERQELMGYKKGLEEAVTRLNRVHRVDLVIRMVVRTMVQRVGVSHAGILLHKIETNDYISTVSWGPSGVRIPEGYARMDAENPLIRFFRERKDKELHTEGMLVYEDAKRLLDGTDIAQQARDLLKGSLFQMDIFEAVACIPAYFMDELLGILLLGNKKDGTSFVKDELSYFVALASNVAVAIENARLVEDRDKSHLQSILSLAKAVDQRDAYTAGHSDNVSTLSVEIANEMKLSAQVVEVIKTAALLHDIGKIGVPDVILKGERALTPDERALMGEHPAKGAEIILPLEYLKKHAKIVRHHHERFDGTGYPDKLTGDDIPLESRIIALADTFDALTTDRTYRKGRTVREALVEIIRCTYFKGRQFDPDVVEAFLNILKRRGIRNYIPTEEELNKIEEEAELKV